MSSTLKQAIQALKARVADAFAAVEAKGGTLPATQDTANLPAAIASIPSGGVSVVEKDINFFDHRGTVASFTLAEIQDLTELPTPKEYNHLTFDRWTNTLANIKDGKRHNVGALYHTTDGSVRIGVHISGDNKEMQFSRIQGTNIVIDWGDGTTPSSALTHIYLAIGDYDITISGTITNIGLVNLNSYWNKKIIYIETPNTLTNFDFSCGIGNGIVDYKNLSYLQLAPSASNARIYLSFATPKFLVIPSNIIQVLFTQRMSGTQYMAIENGVTALSLGAANSLTGLDCPQSVTSLVVSNSSTLQLEWINLGGVTALAQYVFASSKLTNLIVPSNVASIEGAAFSGMGGDREKNIYILGTPTINTAFWNCEGTKNVHFSSTTPPTLSSGISFSSNQGRVNAYIPSGTTAAYEADTNWAANIAAGYVQLIEE